MLGEDAYRTSIPLLTVTPRRAVSRQETFWTLATGLVSVHLILQAQSKGTSGALSSACTHSVLCAQLILPSSASSPMFWPHTLQSLVIPGPSQLLWADSPSFACAPYPASVDSRTLPPHFVPCCCPRRRCNLEPTATLMLKTSHNDGLDGAEGG